MTALAGRSPVGGGLSFAAALAMVAGAAQAALPPQHQRAREFTAVIGEATRALGGQPIDAVERLTEFEYRVRAGPCLLEVRIAFPPPTNDPVPGPRMFSVTPGKPRCQ